MKAPTFALRLLLVCSIAIAANGAARAQTGPRQGGHELQVWTGGGDAFTGVTSHTGMWNLGLRYGWVLTGPHGPGLLRGRFEYAVDAVPVFLVFENGRTSVGAGLNPFALKWDFDAHGRAVPYFELGGGVLFTNHQVPPNTSRVNFTPTGAFGVHILRDRWNLSLEIRYMHISNAGISRVNPGINTIQFRIGVGKFWRGR